MRALPSLHLYYECISAFTLEGNPITVVPKYWTLFTLSGRHLCYVAEVEGSCSGCDRKSTFTFNKI